MRRVQTGESMGITMSWDHIDHMFGMKDLFGDGREDGPLTLVHARPPRLAPRDLQSQDWPPRPVLVVSPPFLGLCIWIESPP